MYKKRRKEKKTHTHNSPAVPTYCINVAIIITQKNIYLFNVTLAESYRHVIDNKYASVTFITCFFLLPWLWRVKVIKWIDWLIFGCHSCRCWSPDDCSGFSRYHLHISIDHGWRRNCGFLLSGLSSSSSSSSTVSIDVGLTCTVSSS